MGLKKSKGNMYPWVTHTHTHLAGRCPYQCVYCAIQDMASRFPGMKSKYQGPLRLIEEEFRVNYGSGKTIFIENCNDLFAKDVPQDFVNRVLLHSLQWPENVYVFQTKNPRRYIEFLQVMPPTVILLTTIETNRDTSVISAAPPPEERMLAMVKLNERVKKL